MTDKTPAMSELPEPELGYIETDKSRQPAFSARQMREALQSAQPAAAVSDEELDRMDMEAQAEANQNPHGTLYHWRKAYLQAFARAILALRPQAVHPDTARCIKARNDLNAALHGEGALIDDLEHAVANACAKMLRPQAVPMTDEQLKAARRSVCDDPNELPEPWAFRMGIRAAEAHHGIKAHD